MPREETSVTLSERELQVLQMVATGKSNQEIAHQLVISVNTVKVHMRNIFEKLDVQSRTEASLRAIQEGWVNVSGDEGDQLGEGTAPPLKTYVIASNNRATLLPWQNFYLTIASLLTVSLMVIPLLFKKSQDTYVPLIPVSQNSEGSLYASDEPPASTPQARNVSRWTFRDPMPTQRAGLALATFERKIYAIGGVRSNDRATRFVEIYDPATDTWAEGATKPTATTNIGGIVLKDKIYLPGGCANDRQAIDVLEIYDPKADKWQLGQALPAPRCGYGLAAWQDKLYLFGGWDGESYHKTIFVYSPGVDEWEIAANEMPLALGYMGVAVLGDLIYLVGGYDGQSETNQTYAFNPETGEWLEKKPMQQKRGGLGLVTIANHLYAVGGGWNQPLENSEKYNPAADTWTTFETPFTSHWRNLGLTVVETDIYAVGGWDGSAEEYMADLVSYNVLFQLFIPVTQGN